MAIEEGKHLSTILNFAFLTYIFDVNGKGIYRMNLLCDGMKQDSTTIGSPEADDKVEHGTFVLKNIHGRDTPRYFQTEQFTFRELFRLRS